MTRSENPAKAGLAPRVNLVPILGSEVVKNMGYEAGARMYGKQEK